MSKKKDDSPEDYVKSLAKEMHKTVSKLVSDVEEITKENQESILLIKKEISSYETKIREMAEIMTNVDETLGNVFLAIRQNEYLQAYYPEQLGYPTMKVAGTHPFNTSQKHEKQQESSMDHRFFSVEDI